MKPEPVPWTAAPDSHLDFESHPFRQTNAQHLALSRVPPLQPEYHGLRRR